MKREQLGSRMGFIMLSAGCAIGCGNVWKFPWMCGQNGGGSFMLVYLLCLIILGIPALTMEFSIGRAAQTSPLYMYRKLEKPGQKWDIFGWFCLVGNIALMAFYTVVCGWLIYYFYKFVIGQNRVSRVCIHDIRSDGQRDFSFCHRRSSIRDPFISPAGRPGAYHKDHDDFTADPDDHTGSTQSPFRRSRKGHALLPEAGFF